MESTHGKRQRTLSPEPFKIFPGHPTTTAAWHAPHPIPRLRDCNGGERCQKARQPAHAPYSFPAARQPRRWAAPKSGASRPCTYTFPTARQPRRWALPKGKAARPCALLLPGCATAEAVGSAEERGKSPMRPTPSRPRDSRGGGHYRKARQLAHAPYPFPAAQRQRRRAVPKSRLSARAPYSFLAAQQQRRRAVPKGEVGRPCALSLPCRAVAKAEGVTEGLLLARVRFQEGLFARRYPFATGGSRLESGGDAFFVPAAYSRRQRPPISTFYRFGGPRRPFPSNQACTDAPRTIAGAVRGMSEARASPPVSPRPFGCSLFRGCR